MAAPRFEVVTKTIQNPHATMPLHIPILVLCNTPDEDLRRNIAINAARDLPWIKAEEPHDKPAILVGGGPSAAGHLQDIRRLKLLGGTIFALNGASRWLREHGVTPDYQVIADAKAETAGLVDPAVRNHLFASQVHEKTMERAPAPALWHLDFPEMETLFPPERVKRGGYAIVGGGASVGNAATCLAYAMGYRSLHLFGYDSCHRNGESHAYRQAMNDFIPTVDVEWAGRTFTASVAMKAQAEKFQITGRALKQAGCSIEVYGDGLLQHMWTAPPENLTERDKYRLMWQFDSYREVSPGELSVEGFLTAAKPDGMIIDFGCGTGRAGLALSKRGHDVLLIDFADNCRDEEAMGLPFMEWDLTRPIPARAPYGLCCDVMEHIPPEDVKAVLANIMESAERVFFRIDTEADECGAIINQPLHLSIHDHETWRGWLSEIGTIEQEASGLGCSVFYVVRK